MTTYAAKTEVPADRSRAEIERTLTRYGADGFAYAWQDTRAVIQFSLHGYLIRFILPLPAKTEPRFTRTPTGKERSPETALTEWEQACRQSWRALALVIKAKLEAIESGIVTLEQEFASQIVLPGGTTVGDVIVPAIKDAYEQGNPAAIFAAIGMKEIEA